MYALSQNVPNQIIGVDDSQVRRRSALGHTSNDQTAITRGMITSLWRELVERGETGEVRLLRFAYALLQRSIAGIAFEPAPRFRLVLVDPEGATRPFVPGGEEIPGLADIPPSPARGAHGGGGEGPIHAALKAKVKHDPVTAVGERLTFISEDLTEALGDEIRFDTGRPRRSAHEGQGGRYVVIEVEPRIGPTDRIGFHQAAKYWALLAVSKGIALDRVRRMVVATEIDPTLREFYELYYSIEWREVTLP